MSEALELLHGLVLEDGRRWGEAAERWQREDAAAVLDQDGPRLHFQTRPRGGSKTGDGAGVAVAALLAQAPRRSRSFAYAADRDQAGLLLDSLAGYVDRTPGLAGALQVDAYRVTAKRSGASLSVEASDDASAWGLRPWLVFVDELAQWKATPGPRRLWSAVFSALPKVPGSRLVALTSSGDPAHWSYAILEQARGSGAWRTSEVPGPCPWLDPADLEVQRVTLRESEYARLHLNKWVAAEDALTTVDDLRACVHLAGPQEPQPGRRYVVTLDLGIKHDRTVAAVCHREGGTVVLDRMAVWSGSKAEPVKLAEVEGWVAQASRAYGGAAVIFDPWQAVALAQSLRRRGVRAHEFSFTAQSVGRIAASLYRTLREHRLALPDDDALLEELANVRLRETSPGVIRMDHDPDKHDDRAVALALAVHHLEDDRALGDRKVSRTMRSNRGVIGGRDPLAGVQVVGVPGSSQWSGRDPIVD
jgi:phage terminase large subunit-like protein